MLAFGVFAIIALIINAMFAGSFAGRAPCFLAGDDIIAAAAGTFVIVLFVTWFVARQLAAITPSEVLHDY